MQEEHDYEQALYEFYTTPENFRTMQQVVAHHDRIYHRVLDDFWRAVETELRNQLKQRADGPWTVDRHKEDLKHPHSKILAFRADWCVPAGGHPAVAIGFENLYWKWSPFVGVFVNHEHPEFPKQKLRQALHAEKAFAQYATDDSDWWPYFTHLEEVNAKNRLSEILPATRQGWVESFVAEALTLVKTLVPIAPGIIAKCKGS